LPEKQCSNCQSWRRNPDRYYPASPYGECEVAETGGKLVDDLDINGPLILVDDPDGGPKLYFRENFVCPFWKERVT